MIRYFFTCFLLPTSSHTSDKNSLAFSFSDTKLFDTITVIPDIHGDADSLLKSLYLTVENICIPNLSFSDFLEMMEARMVSSSSLPPLCSSRNLFIQLGDVADRGTSTRASYLIMDTLQKVMGSPVGHVLGNHELYTHAYDRANALVHADDIKSFGGDLNYRRAFGEGGKMWDIIFRNYKLAIRVGDSLFVHGGINLAWFRRDYPIYNPDGSVNIDKLNLFTSEILKHRNLIQSILLHPSSPLMTRDFETKPEDELCSTILPVIRRLFKISRIFVGHMPSTDVSTRCKGAIVKLDFGMSRWMRPSKQGRAGFVKVTLREGVVETVSKTVVWAETIRNARNVQISFLELSNVNGAASRTSPIPSPSQRPDHTRNRISRSPTKSDTSTSSSSTSGENQIELHIPERWVAKSESVGSTTSIAPIESQRTTVEPVEFEEKSIDCCLPIIRWFRSPN
jgi:hypothetical protein